MKSNLDYDHERARRRPELLQTATPIFAAMIGAWTTGTLVPENYLAQMRAMAITQALRLIEEVSEDTP